MSALKILNDLKKYDIQATVITRNPNRLISQLPSIHNDRNLTFFVGDIKTIQLGKVQCDFLIHGATTSAQETFDGVNDLSKFDLLVDGTRNLMRQVDQCKRAIFLSSGVVYGTSDRNEEKTEVDLWAPPTVGAQLGLANGKRAAEFIFSENCRSLKIDFLHL